MAIEEHARFAARMRSRPSTPERRGTAKGTARPNGEGEAGSSLSVLLVNEPALIRDCLSDMLQKGTRSLDIFCMEPGDAPPEGESGPTLRFSTSTERASTIPTSTGSSFGCARALDGRRSSSSPSTTSSRKRCAQSISAQPAIFPRRSASTFWSRRSGFFSRAVSSCRLRY